MSNLKIKLKNNKRTGQGQGYNTRYSKKRIQLLFVINMWECMGTRTWYADHVAGYPINMHWEKKAQTPARQPRCSKIEIEKQQKQQMPLR